MRSGVMSRQPLNKPNEISPLNKPNTLGHFTLAVRIRVHAIYATAYVTLRYLRCYAHDTAAPAAQKNLNACTLSSPLSGYVYVENFSGRVHFAHYIFYSTYLYLYWCCGVHAASIKGSGSEQKKYVLETKKYLFFPYALIKALFTYRFR